jgi:hypothetical protein
MTVNEIALLVPFEFSTATPYVPGVAFAGTLNTSFWTTPGRQFGSVVHAIAMDDETAMCGIVMALPNRIVLSDVSPRPVSVTVAPTDPEDGTIVIICGAGAVAAAAGCTPQRSMTIATRHAMA